MMTILSWMSLSVLGDVGATTLPFTHPQKKKKFKIKVLFSYTQALMDVYDETPSTLHTHTHTQNID